VTTQRLRLTGPAARGPQLDATLLRDLLDALVHAVQQSVRLRVEGRSRGPGRLPAWLERASAFTLVDLQDGSTQLVFSAPTLAEAAPEQFAQADLFAPVGGNRTCLDVLADSLADALSSSEDSDLYDEGLVETFQQFDRVLRHGIDAIDLAATRTVRVDRPGVETLRQLRQSIPPDQHVRVEGKVDLLRHSDRVFTLLLDAGTALRGVLSDEAMNLEAARGLWGQRARVEGRARFRPSGTVLRVDADSIGPAAPGGAVFSESPRPVFAPLDERSLHRTQGPRSGVAAVIGQWPGEETDTDFEAAITELS
jgi:hypothetical protein